MTDEMDKYNKKANALCERVQDQIHDDDDLNVVMEMVTFMAAATGLQILEGGLISKEKFLSVFVNALVEAMDELSKQEEADKLTRSNYVQ